MNRNVTDSKTNDWYLDLDMSDPSQFDASPPQPDSERLTWDDSFAVALALSRAYPQVDLEAVSLGMIYRWTIALPEFIDDPRMANEEILASIYQEWYEEVITL